MLQTERFHFNCVHNYCHPQWSEEKNSQIYGQDYSPFGLSHNFIFEITLSGSVDKDLRAEISSKIQPLLAELHQKDLSDDIKGFRLKPSTLEGVIQYCWRELEIVDFRPISLWGLRLYQEPSLWATITSDSPEEVSVTKTYKINCLHKHENLDLTREDNSKLYGKCSNIHGHEYLIEVGLRGHIDKESQLLYRRQWLDDILDQNVIQPLDKSFLNQKLGNTSGELIVNKLVEILEPFVPEELILQLCVRETRKNSFYSDSSQQRIL